MLKVRPAKKGTPACLSAYTRSYKSVQRGFNLVEVTVVVAIVAVLGGLAVSSLDSLIVSNRLRAAANDLTLSLQFARSEAARQNIPVTLCPSADGINCTASNYEAGWIVKTQVFNVAGVLLQDTLPKQRVTMASQVPITFLPNGKPIGAFVNTLITVQDDSTSYPDLNRSVCVAQTGRVKVLRAGMAC